jgi:hypothetical protein
MSSANGPEHTSTRISRHVRSTALLRAPRGALGSDRMLDEPDQPTHRVSATVGMPYESLQSVGRSVSFPYEVLQSVGASLELPYDVVQAASADLAAMPEDDLREVRSMLERAQEAGANAAEYADEIRRRVEGAAAARLLLKALDTYARIEVAKQLIDYILKH